MADKARARSDAVSRDCEAVEVNMVKPLNKEKAGFTRGVAGGWKIIYTNANHSH
jgi:hypothetical protein